MVFLVFFRPAVTVKVGVLMGSVFVLKFQTRMTDAKIVLQPVLDCRLDIFDLTPAVRCQHDVAVQSRLMLLHLPQMGGSIMRMPPS